MLPLIPPRDSPASRDRQTLSLTRSAHLFITSSRADSPLSCSRVSYLGSSCLFHRSPPSQASKTALLSTFLALASRSVGQKHTFPDPRLRGPMTVCPIGPSAFHEAEYSIIPSVRSREPVDRPSHLSLLSCRRSCRWTQWSEERRLPCWTGGSQRQL